MCIAGAYHTEPSLRSLHASKVLTPMLPRVRDRLNLEEALDCKTLVRGIEFGARATPHMISRFFEAMTSRG